MNPFRRLLILVLFLMLMLAKAGSAAAGAGQVASGDLKTYAAGLERGYQISGKAILLRTADGRTLAKVQAWGLASQTTYPVHVHNAPCAVNNGGGHYQHEVGGAVDSINEIWPGITSNVAGHGVGHAANDFTARPEAQAVVIHDTDGARIACADLE